MKNRIILLVDQTIQHKPRHMVRVILIGTLAVDLVLTSLLLISLFALHNSYVSSRVAIGLIVLIYLAFALFILHRNHFKVVAWMLLSLYALVGCVLMLNWSIDSPFGILIFALLIVLSGIMLGAKSIIPVSLGVVILLCVIQLTYTLKLTHPDLMDLAAEPNFGDVAGYGTIFAIFALLAWLSGRQMEKALKDALSAEFALEQEKTLLASRLEERTLLLKEAQLKEMQQLYKFAELGQLTAITLHELANYLSMLTLDIDDLQQRHKQSSAVKNAKESIGYLDTMINQVRRRLKQSNDSENFDVYRIINETIDELRPKASKSNITIDVNHEKIKKRLLIHGDPLRFSQSIIILINNAVDACKKDTKLKCRVLIETHYKDKKLYISVIDYGAGIPSKLRKELFQPLKSSKENGLGIGLYITRQVIESHFQGSIFLDDRRDRTEFVIILNPLS